MKNFPYDKSYYKNNYVSPIHVKLKIAYIYYLWLAFFCIILSSKIKRGSRVLDVGCGIGNLVWALRKLGMDAYGIEPSIAAKNMSVSPRFCLYKNYRKLPFQDNNFDLIYTNEVLEHISEKELNFHIKDLLRVSTGKIINMIGVEERGPMVTEEPTHLIIRNEEWWEKRFKNLGFTVKKGNIFYFFPYFPRKINIRGIKKGYFLLKAKSN